MRLRKTYLVEDQSVTGTGTKTYDLDFTDPIRALVIGIYGKKYDMSDTLNPDILREIDKIEVVDGSDVLFSTTGTEAAAVQFYHTGVRPFMTLSNNSTSGRCVGQVKLLFGRSPSDNEFGLDCTKFTNPQLKITYSFTEAAGSWAANTQTLTVAAVIAEGAAKPRGFFMTKEIYTWTKATTGDVTIDMPRDLPYRFIVMQATDCLTPVYAEFSKTKISCNFDEFVPVNMTTEDLAWENLGIYGLQYIQGETIGDGSDTAIKAYYPLAWNWGAWMNSWNSGQSAVLLRPYSHYSTVGRATTGASSGADLTMTFLASSQRAIYTGFGFEFEDTEVIRFGDINDSIDWFDPRPWKSVRLILTQAQTAVASAIVLQQVRPY